MDSILLSVKKMLGITEDYVHFDQDIIMHINTVFVILHQLGVGPSEVFSITDEDALWIDFDNDDLEIESVKTYMYLRVRLMFDPPANSIIMESMQRIINELEWRLHVTSDGKDDAEGIT